MNFFYKKDVIVEDMFGGQHLEDRVGFWVVDKKHPNRVQLFQESFSVFSRDPKKKETYRLLMVKRKLQELLIMFDRWWELSKYMTDVWTDENGQTHIKQYPKPKEYLILDKI